MRRILMSTVAGGLLMTLAACGGTPDEPGSTGSATRPADTTSPTASSTYLPTPEPELTLPATRLGRLERLSGVVGSGVEQGCRLLTPDQGGRALVLLVEDPRVVDGTRVTVEGYRSDGPQGIVTTCQQGVPFTVTRVVQVGPGSATASGASGAATSG